MRTLRDFGLVREQLRCRRCGREPADEMVAAMLALWEAQGVASVGSISGECAACERRGQGWTARAAEAVTDSPLWFIVAAVSVGAAVGLGLSLLVLLVR